MRTEEKVAAHYTREGLTETILRAVQAAVPLEHKLTAVDLAPLDEFHVGGIEATRDLAAQMDLIPGLQLLDVGCGIGGPARYFAAEHGCIVSGVDLTDEFVAVARALTKLMDLDRAASFQVANATSLPFEPATFDRAYMIHVGMNIEDKAAVFREVRRVLKPGGLFSVFDIMRMGDGPLRFPVPWALTEDTSFIAAVADYKAALETSGFRIEKERDRRAFGVEFTERRMSSMGQDGPPVLGLQLLMGEQARPMIGNILSLMKEGLVGPVELIARAQ